MKSQEQQLEKYNKPLYSGRGAQELNSIVYQLKDLINHDSRSQITEIQQKYD